MVTKYLISKALVMDVTFYNSHSDQVCKMTYKMMTEKSIWYFKLSLKSRYERADNYSVSKMNFSKGGHREIPVIAIQKSTLNALAVSHYSVKNIEKRQLLYLK